MKSLPRQVELNRIDELRDDPRADRIALKSPTFFGGAYGVRLFATRDAMISFLSHHEQLVGRQGSRPALYALVKTEVAPSMFLYWTWQTAKR